MITNEVQFRRGVFNLLHNLKNQMDDDEFTRIIDSLEEKLGNVPNNNFEESKAFFSELTSTLLQALENFYEISHQSIENELFHSDSFNLKATDEIVDMEEKYTRYKNMARFRDSFLQEYNYDLWRRFRSQYHGGRLKDRCIVGENDNLIFTTNKFPVQDEFYLPKDSYNRPVGITGDSYYFVDLFRLIGAELTYMTNLRNDFESLTQAVEVFNQRLEASLREEHVRFGVVHLKDILSKIIVPVALIEDDRLREYCLQHNRQVFVKTPTMEDLMYIGSSVHVYSSFDMNDDSSYIAKPIIISETLPGDTDELKYLGVGQFTLYDPESDRSLSGENPYVINNNIYVKANYEDFLALVPEELVEEMEICKNLLESLENPVENVQIDENETLKTIIDNIMEDETLDYKKIIDDFMASSSYFAIEEERETGPVFIHEEQYKFERSRIDFNPSLLCFNNTHPHGYLVIKDSAGNYAGIRVIEDGTKELFISTDPDEIFKALQMETGLYTIYKFSSRHLERPSALLTIHNFNK